jgi:hypothetical protein
LARASRTSRTISSAREEGICLLTQRKFLFDANAFRRSATGREIRRERILAATSGDEILEGWTKIDFVERLTANSVPVRSRITPRFGRSGIFTPYCLAPLSRIPLMPRTWI